jgi:hypothetical protein
MKRGAALADFSGDRLSHGGSLAEPIRKSERRPGQPERLSFPIFSGQFC